jgi:thioredoxin reductase (NADPH)
VSLSYRRAELSAKSIKYWLLPEINDLIRSGRMQGYFNTIVKEITPNSVRLEKCDSEGSGLGAVGSENLDFDFVLLLVGYKQDNSLLRLAGVDVTGDCGAPVFNERTMETNVPGIYVAGTAVAGTQDKYRVFIENCHVHVDRILAALTGAAAPAAPEKVALPES